ncbi:MAG: SPFH domain-containing protein [Mariprofundales bacterium]|nr:SPFH domain-containing protein [Mariprofundales bacterium]
MEISATLIIVLILVGFIVLTIISGIRIVPQGAKYIVQRLGKYHSTLLPGLNLIIPYIDGVAAQVTTKDIVMDIPDQEVITKDNAVIRVNAVAFINLIHPEKAIYGVDNYEHAIVNIMQTTLRSIIGEMKLDDALSSREVIKTRIRETTSDDIADWGVLLKSVEIQDITPSPTMQQAMEEQAAAERSRRAMVTRADGEKQSAILSAEGRLEASKRDAEAQVVLAEASKQAIQAVTESISDKELPAMYLLGQRYIEAIEKTASSENSKIILLPADLHAAVKGLLGK